MGKIAKVEAKPKLYTVIRDTREQQGWIFEESPYCAGTIIKTMKTGDYTLAGLEEIFCVERKKNVSEFAKNILEERFEKEMVRLQNFSLSFIVCEFTMDDIMRWPLGSGIPKYKLPYVKMSKYFILKRLMDFQVQYNTKFIFAGVHGKEVMSSLFKRVFDNVKKECVESTTKTKVSRGTK